MEVIFMKKIAIVCDTSASMTPEQIKQTGVTEVALTIIHNGKEYLDQETITNQEVNDLLRENKVVTTSQPNLGLLIDVFTKLKKDGYDHIFALPLTRHLSGTYNSFEQAINEVGLDNITLIDTQTLIGPIQKAVDVINEANKAGDSIKRMTEKLYHLFDNTESYLLPLNLKQLKASGRISSAAATMASLLKIKVVLKIKNKALNIDKFDTARTEAKSVDIVIDDLVKHNVKPETHDIYMLHSEGKAFLDRFVDRLTERLGTFKVNISELPSSLATHAGLGTIAIQYTLKNF